MENTRALLECPAEVISKRRAQTEVLETGRIWLHRAGSCPILPGFGRSVINS